MKRTPLIRRTPMKRRKRLDGVPRGIERKPPRESKRRPRDPAYLAAVRRLPCRLASDGKCLGAVQAHHAGVKPGMGIKAPDDTAIPLCMWHHGAFHGASGFFRDMRAGDRRRWQEQQITAVRQLLVKPTNNSKFVGPW